MARVGASFDYPGGAGYPGHLATLGWTSIYAPTVKPAFDDTGTSHWYGKVAAIHSLYPSGTSVLRFRLAGSGTGNVRMELSVHKVGSTGATDSAMTTIAAQTVSLAGTVRNNVTAAFSMPFSVDNGDTLSFRISRYGDDAADTAAVSIICWDAHLSDS